MSVIVEISIFPLDKGESVSRYVAKAVKVIQDSGLPYELNPMGTCVAGDWDEVMAMVDRCFKELQKESDRIYLTMKADYRKGRSDRLEGKVESVREKL
ncbi:MAG: MTH1187 family thiamine-binding protein [Desulfobacteraceae bacterium]|nr:MTH1187 family thiamine-binding protein [Desulfobacteraceae bacterium]